MSGDDIWKALLSGFMLVLGWLHVARRTETRDMKVATQSAHRAAAAASKDLADHKLYAAETFATRADVSAGMDKMEGRLAAQLERLQDSIEDVKARLPPRTA